MAVIAVAATATQVVGQVQQANAINKSINQQNELKQQEIDKSATAEINDRLREARRERGRIVVAAGESGLSLSSGGVENLLLDSFQQAELANDRSMANRESRKLAAAAEAQSQLQSKPTVLGAGLQIALAGAKGYASGSAAQTRSGN